MKIPAQSSAVFDTLLFSAYRSTQYKHRLRRRSTYDELISAGTIGLIHNQSLRDSAIRLYNIATIENMVREGHAVAL